MKTEIKEPILHYATDRRCYNGALCSDLQRELDSQNNILKAIEKEYPEFSCTYFPGDGKYLAFLKYKQLSEHMYSDRGQCLLDAWRMLLGKTK